MSQKQSTQSVPLLSEGGVVGPEPAGPVLVSYKETTHPEKATIFLSYSRADSPQMLRIATALVAADYRVNYDNAQPSTHEPDIGISAQDEWWLRLQDMIVGAEVMVLLVSPASAKSRVVDEEIAFARGEGKRIIPVLCRPIDFSTAPPRLAALNVKISFVDQAPQAFAAAIAHLCSAVDQDIEWLRMGRAINQKSNEWRTAKRARDRLLHGEAIAESERWSARRPGSAPAIGEDTLAFIAESRTAEEERIRNERAQLERQRRMQRWIGWLIVLALLAVLIGAGIVLNRQRQLARSESVMLARVAEELFTQGDYVRAMRLSALGLAEGPLRPGSPEADAVFQRAMLSPVLEREFPTSATVAQDWAAADGSLAVFADSAGSGSLSFWRIDTGALIAGNPRDDPISDVGFAVGPQGTRFVSWGSDLKSDYAFQKGNEADKARFGTLWSVDGAGQVTASRRQRYPILGGLLPTAEGSILTWGRSRITLWSSDFDQRITEVRLSAPVETARTIGDGRRVLMLLQGGRVEIWSVDLASALERLAARSVGQRVGEIATAPQENLVLLVTATDELVALDLGRLALRYRGVAQLCCFGPPQIKTLPDPQNAAGQSVLLNVVPQMGARLIRVATGETFGPTFAHQGIRGARFDDEGERVVTYGADNTAYVWDVKTGARWAAISQDDSLGIISGRAGPPGGMRGAAFLGDGTAVVVWNYDGTIRVYSASTGKQIGGHMRHPGPVRDVLLLPDRRVMTVSDGPVRVWRLPDYAAPVSSFEGLCSSIWPNLNTVRLSRVEMGGSALSLTIYEAGRVATGPALVLDAEDTRLVPILRGREGEALCAARTGP